ncbi:MAG: tRNA 2-selenouridine(34) synthase MnmH [Bacteroidetes bacterium]|nr:tRNA 2-selenouridine(34) synthase MnmH [Bacteroidota bacterium]
MAITRIQAEEFLALAQQHPVLDVRSPGEFGHAHIPGAHSLPLFSDEERKVVGTAYKQESQQKAIKLGLDFFGVKMVKLVEAVEEILDIKNKQQHFRRDQHIVLVHCWRGGMRSAGVAWMLDLYGFRVYTLAGGYKAYRKWVLDQFNIAYPINIIGGFTGSGKTEALQALAQKKQSVIDLEGLSNHKGSAFGALGQPAQPSQEMFENLLAAALKKTVDSWQAGSDDRTAGRSQLPKVIWLEDESQRIGEVNLPAAFFRQMRDKQIYFLDIPFEERLQFLVEHYGKFEKEKLISAILRIKKRLGGLETKNAVSLLIEDNTKDCFAILLAYYDKFYLKSLQNRENFSSLFNKVVLNSVSAEATAEAVLTQYLQKAAAISGN